MAAASASSSASSTDASGYLLPSPMPERGKAMRLHVSSDGALMAYGVGNTVVVRSTVDLTTGFVYEEHTEAVKCAAFSPNGEFIASGDTKGGVRVWSATDPAFALRKELLGLPGGVEDIAWDASGTVLGLAGEGVDKVRMVTADSGTDVGTMATQAKTCLAVAASSTTPSAFAFGGEAKHVGLYAGKPGKLVANLTEHTAFVNAVAFSPDGTKLVTAGSDKVILVRDAATGAVLSATKAAHKGSIYSVAFSADGTSLATSSADKTIVVWEMAADGSSLKATNTIVVGKAISDMQNGMVWAGDAGIISASLCGNLNVSAPTDSAPSRVLHGPGGPVTTMRSDGDVFLTGDRSGTACLWTRKDGAAGYEAARVGGDGHPKVVNCGDICEGRFVTGGFDDKLRFGTVAGAAYTAVAVVGAQPKGVVLMPTNPGVAVVATSKFVKSFSTDSGAELSSVDAKWEGKAVAASPDGKAVFVGGGDGLIRRYTVDASGALTETGVSAAPLKNAVAALAVSPDGAHVAAGDAGKEVVVLDAASLAFKVKDKWTAHTSRVASLAWNSTGSALVSTGVDRHVFVWAVDEAFPVSRHNLAVAAPAHSIVWEHGDGAVWVSASNGVTKRIPVAM